MEYYILGAVLIGYFAWHIIDLRRWEALTNQEGRKEVETIITIVLINGKKFTGRDNDFYILSSFAETNVMLNVLEKRVVINSNQIAYIRGAEDYEIEHYKQMGLKGV